MSLNHRIIYSDNGTLTDLTGTLNNYKSSTQAFTWVSAQDYLYISSILPFNHQYFSVTTANASAALISIDLWNGSNWESSVDIHDGTLDATRTIAFSQSGHVTFALDKTKQWPRSDTDKMTSSGISSLKIFDHYWCRLSLNANISFTLKYIGQKFSEDEDLAVLYPDLSTSDAKLQFNNGVAGKTTWDDQHIAASEIIIRDLENIYQIRSGSQIIRYHRLTHASIHKVAEIIFNSHGNDGRANRDDARLQYEESIKFTNTQFDQNANTRLDEFEGIPNLRVVRR